MHRSAWGLLVGLAVSATTLAAPSPREVTTDALVGTALNDGPHMRMSWSSWVATPLATVRARMTDWARASKLVQDVLDFSLHHESQGERPARFQVKRKSPVFFIPNPTIVFDATHVERDDGSVVITWNAVEGPPKHARRTWTLKPEAGGTRVLHSSHIELPFDPPDFVFGNNPAEQLGDDVERFRLVVGAPQALRGPPAAKRP
jgi:hypothetical protein